MKATIKKELNKEKRVKVVLDCIKNIYGFDALDKKEVQLLVEVVSLPEMYKYTPTPFSLTMKKIYQDRMGLTSTQINTIIRNIFNKGFLRKDDYGEYVIPNSIRRLLESKELSLTLELVEVSDEDKINEIKQNLNLE